MLRPFPMTSHFGSNSIGHGPSSSSESAYLIRHGAVFFRISATVDLKFLDSSLIPVTEIFWKCSSIYSLCSTLV